MSIGTGSDFKIYEEQFFGGYVEALEQNSNAFNASSANSIRLIPNRLKGQYEQESFIQLIDGLVTRRDVTSVSAATDLAMTQGEIVGVKVNRKIGPVANTRDSFRKIAVDPEEMSFLLGQQVGKAVSVEMVNTALACVAAAVGGESTNATDQSAASVPTMTHTHLVTAMSLMGDAAGRVVAWVMHSKAYFDLMKQALSDKLFEVAGVVVYAGTVATFNRPVVVNDSPSLINTTPTPDEYITLGLVADGVIVNESEEREIVSDTITGLENLVTRIQGEYAYNIKVKGFAWDMANGLANPADAALATATNWDKVTTAVTDAGGHKALAGVHLTTQ